MNNKRYFQRIISLAILSSSLLLSVLLNGRTSGCAIVFALAFSAQLLMPGLSRGEKAASVFVPAGVSALLGLGTIVLTAVFDVDAVSALVLMDVIVTAPVVYRMVASGISMAMDMDFLCDTTQGWEQTMFFGNAMHVAFYVFLYLVLESICSLNSGTMDLLGIVSVALMSLAYVYMYLRSMAADDGGPAREIKMRLRDRMRQVMISPSEREISVNSRLLFGRIKEYMEAKRPYLRPGFCLEDMSKAMYTNSGYISRIINTCTGSNFSQFVNTYRVKHAMELYKKDSSLRMTELAQLSGFNTKVTFNMAFKLVAGETPGQWCRHYLESMHQEKDPSSRKEQHK